MTRDEFEAAIGNDTNGQRIARYEVRITRLNWLAGGVVALVGLMTALSLSDYPRWLLVVWTLLVMLAGLAVGNARVGFQHQAGLLRQKAAEASSGEPWPVAQERYYKASLLLIMATAVLLLAMTALHAASGSTAATPASGSAQKGLFLEDDSRSSVTIHQDGGEVAQATGLDTLSIGTGLLVLAGLAYVYYYFTKLRPRLAKQNPDDKTGGAARFFAALLAVIGALPTVAAALIALLDVRLKWRELECFKCESTPPPGASCPDGKCCKECGDAPLREVQTFYLTFPEGGCAANGEPTEASSTVEWQRPLADLKRSLEACARSAPVAVDVLGFASSSGVENWQRCQGATGSDDANLMIAQARARRIATTLNSDNVQARAHDWRGSFEDMKEARNFNDILARKYDEEAGRFNRRVEIRITDRGGCSKEEIKDATAAPTP